MGRRYGPLHKHPLETPSTTPYRRGTWPNFRGLFRAAKETGCKPVASASEVRVLHPRPWRHANKSSSAWCWAAPVIFRPVRETAPPLRTPSSVFLGGVPAPTQRQLGRGLFFPVC